MDCTSQSSRAEAPIFPGLAFCGRKSQVRAPVAHLGSLESFLSGLCHLCLSMFLLLAVIETAAFAAVSLVIMFLWLTSLKHLPSSKGDFSPPISQFDFQNYELTLIQLNS